MIRKLGIDVSQLYSWPAASGIQRLLLGLLKTWPDNLILGECVFWAAGELHRVDRETVASALEQRFSDTRSDVEAEEAFRLSVWKARTSVVPVEDLGAHFDAWLLPEPSYQSVVLRNLRQALQQMPVGALLMDITPERADNRVMASAGHSSFSEYFRLMRQVDTCMSISRDTQRDLLHRLRRPAEASSPVVLPGVDYVPSVVRDESPRPRFLVVGTLIERKRIRQVIEAFRQASLQCPNLELRLVGRADPASGAAIVDQVRRVQQEGLSLNWQPDATDEVLWQEYSRATAHVIVGMEGYGLTALEALAAGCPVVASREVPSVEAMEGRGVVFVDPLNPSELAELFVSLAEPGMAQELAGSPSRASLPTENGFSEAVGLTMWMLADGYPATWRYGNLLDVPESIGTHWAGRFEEAQSLRIRNTEAAPIHLGIELWTFDASLIRSSCPSTPVIAREDRSLWLPAGGSAPLNAALGTADRLLGRDILLALKCKS